MTDREQVVKGLKTVWICDTSRIHNLEDKDCINCPYRCESGLCNGQQLADDAIALLKEQEAVVRCKDCKYYHGVNLGCGALNLYPKPDWFCADGERKE